MVIYCDERVSLCNLRDEAEFVRTKSLFFFTPYLIYIVHLLSSGLDLPLTRLGICVGLSSRLQSCDLAIGFVLLVVFEQLFQFGILSTLAQKFAQATVVDPDGHTHKDSVADGRLVDLVDLNITLASTPDYTYVGRLTSRRNS